MVRFYVLASLVAARILHHHEKSIDWSETLNNQQCGSALTELHALYRLHGNDEKAIENQAEMGALDLLLQAADARAVR